MNDVFQHDRSYEGPSGGDEGEGEREVMEEEEEEEEVLLSVAESGSPVHMQADLQYLHRSLRKVTFLFIFAAVVILCHHIS